MHSRAALVKHMRLVHKLQLPSPAPLSPAAPPQKSTEKRKDEFSTCSKCKKVHTAA